MSATDHQLRQAFQQAASAGNADALAASSLSGLEPKKATRGINGGRAPQQNGGHRGSANEAAGAVRALREGSKGVRKQAQQAMKLQAERDGLAAWQQLNGNVQQSLLMASGKGRGAHQTDFSQLENGLVGPGSEKRKQNQGQWFPSLSAEGGPAPLGKGIYSQMMQGMSPVNGHANGMEQGGGMHNDGRRIRQYAGHTQADSSENSVDEMNHHHNLHGHPMRGGAPHMLLDPCLNPEALLGLSAEDHALHQQNQAAAMLMQQMGLGLAQNTEKQWTCLLQQQKMKMGNQLRIFALDMFKIMTKSQKKLLEKKAKVYLDNCMKDQKRLQQLNMPGQSMENGQDTQMNLSAPSFLDSPGDFEFEADPKKYIDEIQKSLNKHKEISDNFQVFIQMMFDDTEQEQVYTNFITQNPEVHQYYMGLAIQYNHFGEVGDYERQEAIGTEIFNLIMPHAQQVDSRLLQWIPKEVVDQFEIVYESDGFHIKDWRLIDEDDEDDDDASDSDMNSCCHSSELQSDSSDARLAESSIKKSDNNQDAEMTPFTGHAPSLSSRGKQEQESDDEEEAEEEGEQEEEGENSMSDQNDCSSDNNQIKSKDEIAASIKLPNEHSGSPSMIKKPKSFLMNFNQLHGNKRNINRFELKTIDNFFRSIKDEKDQDAFCRLFFGYYEGIYSLNDFLKLYDDKFHSKVKLEVRDDVAKLLQTRDQSRRTQSNLLKPWNDHENQTFEKIPGSSYFKIDDDFPIPTCSAKMIDEIYYSNINDRYLSLAIGTENFQFRVRNQYEDNIYKAEDSLQTYETQIDNIERSHRIVSQILVEYNEMSETEQANFKFPSNRLNPYRFYWERKLRQLIHDQYLREGRVIKQKELIALRKLLTDRLEYQKNQRNQQINEIKEQFRKNFTRSLDHKSVQYKDKTIKRLVSKTVQLQKIRQLQEETLFSHIIRKDLLDNRLSVLYGSGELPKEAFQKFFNTFGQFGRTFDEERLQQLESTPDHPIDLQFFDKLPQQTLQRHQAKCPQARFLMNDSRTFQIVIKLLIRHIKIQASLPANHGKIDSQELLDALKFVLNKFLMVQDFDLIEEQSDVLQPMTPEQIDILMNSAQYYQKKYDGTLELMCELYPIAGLQLTNQVSLAQSPQPHDDLLGRNNDDHDSEVSSFRIQELKDRDDQSSYEENEMKYDKSKCYEGSQAQSQQGSVHNQAQSQADLSENVNMKQTAPGDNLMEDDVHRFKALKLEEQSRQNSSTAVSFSEDEAQMLLEAEMEQSLFIPQFDSSEYQKHQQQKHADSSASQQQQQYKLFYCPLNVYLFMMYFYSVYERVLKARELVAVKIEQDFNEDFSKNEWSQKFAKKKQALADERIQYLIKAILTTMSNPSTMDNSKYEDLARQLLGNEAYLLFLIDKVIKNCTHQLNLFQNDQACLLAQKLFIDFEDQKVKRESTYLVNFFEEANKLAIQNARNQQSGRHNSHGAAGNSGASSRDNQNPSMSRDAFRLLYSPKSNIMTAHYICFSPFYLSNQSRQASQNLSGALSSSLNGSGGINPQECLSFLRRFTSEKRRLMRVSLLDQGKVEESNELVKQASQDVNRQGICESSMKVRPPRNKVSESSQPVFLNRNLKKMKKHRESVLTECLQQSRGLIARMLPISQNIYFEAKTEDYLHFKRETKTTKATVQCAQSSGQSIAKGKQSRNKKVLGKRNQPVVSSQESAIGPGSSISETNCPSYKNQDFLKQLQYRSILNKRFKSLEDDPDSQPTKKVLSSVQNPQPSSPSPSKPQDQAAPLLRTPVKGDSIRQNQDNIQKNDSEQNEQQSKGSLRKDQYVL